MTTAIICARPPPRNLDAVVASQPTVRISGGLWLGAVTVPLRFRWSSLARGRARPARSGTGWPTYGNVPPCERLLSRLTHAYGIVTASSLAAEGKLRFAGAMGTYVFGIGLAIATAFTV